MSTPKTDDETLGAKQSQEDREELDRVENEMVDTTLAASMLDQCIISTSSVSIPEPARLDIDLESTPVEEGIDTHMISSSAPLPLPPQQE